MVNKNGLNVEVTDNSFYEFKEEFGKNKLEEYNLLFVTEEYINEDTLIIQKSPFCDFLKEKDDSKIKMVEYRKNIDKITLYNSIFINIGEFFVKEIIFQLFIAYLYDFIKSKINNTDEIKVSMNIETKEDNNIKIDYCGSADDFKEIFQEMNHFKDLVENGKSSSTKN